MHTASNHGKLPCPCLQIALQDHLPTICRPFADAPAIATAAGCGCCFFVACLARLQVGVFLQHMTTFIVGFIVAFVKGWDMTLVLVGCLPFLAGIGSVLAKMTTTLSNKQTAAYTEVRGPGQWPRC